MAENKGRRPAGSRVRYAEGGRAKRIKTGGAQWSEEAEEAFLDALSATCNVRMAAAHVGFTTFTPYRQRRIRPAFAARWQAALEQGYIRLEWALLSAAVDSMEGTAFDAEAPIPRMTVEEAQRTLRLHRAAAGDGRGPRYGRPAPRPVEQVRASILRKIETIVAARGLDGDGAAPADAG